MTSVLQLLTLPVSSNGFTALPHSIADFEPSSAHKTPRRATDSDSPSAAKAAHTRANQPTKIQVVGSSHRSNAPRPNTLQQCIKHILTRDSVDPRLPTHEAIYSECMSAVCVLGTGEGLYQTLKLQLEQSVSRLSKELLSEKKDHGPGAIWINKFVNACKWFETQVVRALQTDLRWSSLLPRLCFSLF